MKKGFLLLLVFLLIFTQTSIVFSEDTDNIDEIEELPQGDGIISKPKLIIEAYKIEPKLVKAGENFTIKISFLNTHKNKKIENIKIFFTVDEQTEESGNVFTPVNGSNTIFIDSIPPKGKVHREITMYTVPDAKPKNYTITANLEYDDNEGQEIIATELIGVPVIQNARLQIGDINVSPEAYTDEPFPVSLEFYNTGKVTLYNLMVKLEGDFATENGNYFVGNLESGGSDFFEGIVIPNKAGALKGNLIFTYEDSAGKTIEDKREFSANVEEEIPMDPEDDEYIESEELNESKNILKSKVFWFILVVLVATVIGFKVWKNKRKGMTLDDYEYEDE